MCSPYNKAAPKDAERERRVATMMRKRQLHDLFMHPLCFVKVSGDTELDVLSSKRSHVTHVLERPLKLNSHKYTFI